MEPPTYPTADLYWKSNVCILRCYKAEQVLNKFAFYMRKGQAADPDKLWIRKTTEQRVRVWWELTEGNKTELVFPHGLIDTCIETLKEMGIGYVLHDRRLPFPKPRLDLMHGFRFRQREKLTEMLLKDRSGLGDFPTRWGKTTLVINTLRAFPGVKTIVTAPGDDLLKQTLETLHKALPDREVKGLFTGCPAKHRGESEDITVASMDSLHKCDPMCTRLVIVDEPHASGAETRAVKLARFENARIYGFGATMSGRADGSDIVFHGLIGPILVQVTYKDAVANGELCPIKAYIVQVPVKNKAFYRLDKANECYIYHNRSFAQLVANISSMLIPPEWQSILFIDREDQATLLKEFVPHYPVAMAKLMTKKQRVEMFERAQAGTLKRVAASSIYSQGVTFSNLMAITNASGGGGSITGVQKPGRLAEVRPGKSYGYLVDFQFIPVGNLQGNSENAVGTRQFFALSRARINKYRNTGYEIVEVPLKRYGDVILPDLELMKFT